MKGFILISLSISLLIAGQASGVCEPNIPGDITKDCKVDYNDVGLLSADWLMKGPVEQWLARYNRPGDTSDSAHAIAIDSNDNICVTGGGWTYWEDEDIITIKYSPDSNQPVWVATYNSPDDEDDSGYAIAIDSKDNIYVTGSSFNIDTCQEDIITIKYSPDSNQPVWVARYNGPDDDSDASTAMAIDSDDNIYVTGYSLGSGTEWDCLTLKYSPDSNQPVWVARYNGPDNDSDNGMGIAIDSDDNIYVTGNSYDDYLTIKYSADSNQPVWVARYNNGGGLAIAIDSNDNIYVTGESYSSETSADCLTLKYSPDSNQPVWVARYNGPDNDLDEPYAIAVDSHNNIYVTGSSNSSQTSEDYLTIKYSPDSNQAVWVARYNGPGNGVDGAAGITTDSNDNIYVTGFSYGSGTDIDYATIKYSPDSNQPAWVARYNGPGNDDDPSAIGIDSNDNIYVTGGSGGDYTTIRYTPFCSAATAADINNDCKVDLTDFAILALDWLECDLDPPQDCWQ